MTAPSGRHRSRPHGPCTHRGRMLANEHEHEHSRRSRYTSELYALLLEYTNAMTLPRSFSSHPAQLSTALTSRMGRGPHRQARHRDKPSGHVGTPCSLRRSAGCRTRWPLVLPPFLRRLRAHPRKHPSRLCSPNAGGWPDHRRHAAPSLRRTQTARQAARLATLAPTRATMTACEGRRFPYAAAVADVATSQQRPLSRCRIFVRCRQGVDEAPPGGSGATGRVNMNAQSSESLFSCLHLQICLREKVEQLTGIGKTDSTIQASVEAGPVHDTTTYRCALDCRLQ